MRVICLSLLIVFAVAAAAAAVQASVPSGLNTEPDGETGWEIIRDGNHTRPAPDLVWRLDQNLRRAALGAQGVLEADISGTLAAIEPPHQCPPSMPSKGTVNLPVFLVDFPDNTHKPGWTPFEVGWAFFEKGDPNRKPYESVAKYYERSSYGQLNLKGKTHGWIRAGNTSASYYTDPKGDGMDLLTREVLTSWDDLVDFRQYDSDGDGYIDGVYFVITEDNLWGPGVTHSYNDTAVPFTVDGKKLSHVVFQIYKPFGSSNDFDPLISIHETGHLLGLPDYYDYDYKTGMQHGPSGGVGGWDMMDFNWGDHNCFSKYLLGWIDPPVVSSGSEAFTLHPSGITKDAVIVMPGYASGDYSEFFMVQYREPGKGNDPLLTKKSQTFGPGHSWPAGLFIWHIDAAVEEKPWGPDFTYDNSYTAHKLLRLMEADGQEHIEQDLMFWDSADIHRPGQRLIPGAQRPNTSSYSGTDTGIFVNQFFHHPNQNPSSMEVRCSVGNGALLLAGFTHACTGFPLDTFTYGFVDLSTGPLDSWKWWFGDGETSILQSPDHTYPAKGTYNVTLVVKGGGQKDALVQTIEITKNPLPPVAGFTWEIPDPRHPRQVKFRDASQGYITARVWKFTDDNLAAGSTKVNPFYEYPDYGIFLVSLKAMNNWGSNRAENYIILTPPPSPVADFSYSFPCGKPRTVHFQDASSGDPHTVTWRFGDGTTVKGKTAVTHAYEKYGNYTVTLIVENDSGTSKSKKEIVVGKPPEVAFSYENIWSPDTTGYPVRFTDESSGRLTDWRWDFGDGVYSTDQNPVHTYLSAGEYEIALRVWNVNGVCGETTGIVAVFSAPPPEV